MGSKYPKAPLVRSCVERSRVEAQGMTQTGNKTALRNHKAAPCEPRETNLGEDDLHNQEGTGYQCSDLKNKWTELRSLRSPGGEGKLPRGKPGVPPYRDDPPVAQADDGVAQEQHDKAKQSQELQKQTPSDTSHCPCPSASCWEGRDRRQLPGELMGQGCTRRDSPRWARGDPRPSRPRRAPEPCRRLRYSQRYQRTRS